MLSICLSAISVLAFFVFLALLDYSDKFLIGIISPIIVFFASLFSGIIYTTSCEQSEEYISESVSIVALQDNRDVNGQFFLGAGGIQQDSYYYAYYDEYGDILTDKIPSSNCKIQEDSNKKPCLERHNFRVPLKQQESLAFKLFYVGFNKNGDSILDYNHYYRFTIPKGSIIKNYEVDLK